jgi:hypothetical protein
MTKKQYAILLFAFLLGFCLSKLVSAQQITGPNQALAGTLATFEITPSQVADWTITSVKTTACVFQTDTSTRRLYFATPQSGTYHIVAAIVVDGKPQVLAKTFINGGKDEIKPLPPVPPQPDQPLAEWIKTQLPLLVKSQNVAAERLLVAQCFEQTVQKIDNGTIKTAQNARTQLQIALTMTLAFASDTAIDNWQPFLTALSQQMTHEFSNKINDLDAVKAVFKSVELGMRSEELEVRSVESRPESEQQNTECEICPINSKFLTPNSTLPTPHPTLRTFRLFR